MKVAFDIKNLWLYGKGIGAFTINLLSDLAGNSKYPQTCIELYAPSFKMEALQLIDNHNRFTKVHTKLFDKKSKLDKVKYDQISFLQSLRHNQPDILFSPYFDIPLFWQKPVITTIHDLSIFEMKGTYSKAFYTYYTTLLRKAIRKSSFIVTVSNHSRNKLIEAFNLPEERLKIIYNKVPCAFLQDTISLEQQKLNDVKSQYKLPDEFILYTGGLETRKNIPLLINGISNVRRINKNVPKLVITGIAENNVSPVFKDLLNSENVITLGFLPYDELTCLYQLSSLIVNTSSYEGFGIPVLEALTMQKPILCSDIQVYQEIGKEFVYYFKNNDIKNFENQLLLFFSGQLSSLNSAGMLKQADYFNKRNYSDLFFQMVNNSI